MNLSLSSTDKQPSVFAEPCLHCGNPSQRYGSSLNSNSENSNSENSELKFCCSGCEAVYHWIQDHHLANYYELKAKTSRLSKSEDAGKRTSYRPMTPKKNKTNEDYAYLDRPEFLKLYAWDTPEGRWMEFYLDGVHCSACVWLTEKVAEIVDHVGLIRLNLGTSVATVRVDEMGSFSAVAIELQKMGYRPHPVKRGEHNPLQQKENRLTLIRLGVAGASAGNIMLLAISLYAGATGVLGERFRWISFGLFLPVLLFSAVPFYKSAWASLRSKTMSMDLPVVFGILMGSLVSTLNLLTGDERVYFDSLSTLVFLLLSTRYLLKRTQQTSLDSSRLLHFLTPSSVRKWNFTQKAAQEVPLDELSIGDSVQILSGECIPVDGIVLEGTSSFDCALLSGESDPVSGAPGSIVFAGTVNLDAPILVKVTQSGSQTRVGRIFDSMQTLLSQKAPFTLFADRVARYFVWAVVILSGMTFFGGLFIDWHEGLNRALAIAIVTCPCTFALITPLALSITVGKLARAGILMKGPEVLEKLTHIRSVFLDKTGTLTFGMPEVILWDVPPELSPHIFSIESHSSHPVAKALVNYLRPEVAKLSEALPQIEEMKETLGLGIRGKIEGHWIDLRRSKQATAGTEVSIFKDDVLVGRVVLGDQVRPESKDTINQFRSMNLEPWILSGDHAFPVTQLAETLGIRPNQCISEASPEKKAEIISQNRQALMIGDGANDALALAQAYVGVAVHSGVEISLRAADVYLKTPGIKSVHDLIVIAHETLYIVRRNFLFSIGYNLIAGGFALAGKIDPLIAAILMPVSALTVLFSSVLGTKKIRKSFRELNA